MKDIYTGQAITMKQSTNCIPYEIKVINFDKFVEMILSQTKLYQKNKQRYIDFIMSYFINCKNISDHNLNNYAKQLITYARQAERIQK